jgi:uncharacterized protein YgbK (DUF1537 family)
MIDRPSGTGPLLSFYGDDFTGSTDALEALASNGIPTVLFLEPPDDRLALFRECRAIGIAGESRSQTPEWMSSRLPAIFQCLRQLGAPICQYKICSTFDSSPETGSIGRALEIGLEVFGTPYAPVVAPALHLARYVLFGHLFAGGGGAIHRIDRHPTMKSHPVTPMNESDLRIHLARQTERKICHIDVLALGDRDLDAHFDAVLAERPAAILFDGLDAPSMRQVGRLVWTKRGAPQSFAIGSSGLTYALIDYWRSQGWIPAAPEAHRPGPADRLLAISGSLSPVTERQIGWALANGFSGVPLDLADLIGPSSDKHSATVERATTMLQEGRSVVLYTARRSETPLTAASRNELGTRLGVLLKELIERSGVRRALVAGGDTSSHAGAQLGVYAVTFVAPMSPGAPLCRAHAADPAMDGIEIMFKGGQNGPDDFFGMVLSGSASSLGSRDPQP